MCLDEWKSGSYKALTFTSDVYEPIYKVHLANLKVLEEEDPLFITGLGEELWEDCRYVHVLGYSLPLGSFRRLKWTRSCAVNPSI